MGSNQPYGVPLLSPVRIFADDPNVWTSRPPFSQILESMARSAVANCSPVVLIPPITWATKFSKDWDEDQSLRTLAPSTRKRIRFIDRRNSTWRAIASYFLPIKMAVDSEMDTHHDIDFIALFFYYLVIASRRSAQFFFCVARVTTELDNLLREQKRLPEEVAMRLSVLRGSLKFLEYKQQLPGLSVRGGCEYHFSNHLQEILEDAYLAEASFLRRFLSFEANKASVRRDLRRVLQAITTERKWSKGVITLTEQLAIVPHHILETAGKLLQEMCDLPATAGPIVLTSLSAIVPPMDNQNVRWIEYGRELHPSGDDNISNLYLIDDGDDDLTRTPLAE